MSPWKGHHQTAAILDALRKPRRGWPKTSPGPAFRPIPSASSGRHGARSFPRTRISSTWTTTDAADALRPSVVVQVDDNRHAWGWVAWGCPRRGDVRPRPDTTARPARHTPPEPSCPCATVPRSGGGSPSGPATTAGFGYPQLRLLALVACGTRTVIDAVFGPSSTSSASSAATSSPSHCLGDGSEHAPAASNEPPPSTRPQHRPLATRPPSASTASPARP